MVSIKIEDRYFLKTELGEVLDGPFKTEDEAKAEAAKHNKKYRYMPIVVVEKCKVLSRKKRAKAT